MIEKSANDLTKKLNVLAVEDEETSAKIYGVVLEEMGHAVTVVLTGEEAISIVHEKQFDLIILDLKLPDMSGEDILNAIRERIKDVPVIIITAHPSLDSSIELIRMGGVYDYIVKPFTADSLKIVIRRAVERTLLALENKQLVFRLEKTNQVLTERVDQLEKFASVAVDYEKQIYKLKEKIKKLEARRGPLK